MLKAAPLDSRNVGKSTLFNAPTRFRKAEIANKHTHAARRYRPQATSKPCIALRLEWLPGLGSNQ